MRVNNSRKIGSMSLTFCMHCDGRGPVRHLRAVFSVIPAAAAAVDKVSFCSNLFLSFLNCLSVTISADELPPDVKFFLRALLPPLRRAEPVKVIVVAR
jgi:hypothetical protein